MARSSGVVYWWVTGILAVVGLVLVGVSIVGMVQSSANVIPAPERVLPVAQPAPSSTLSNGVQATPVPSATPEEVAPLEIPGAAIEQVSVPAVALNVAVSGETFPRETQNCHGAVLCIDPPVSNQAAWYGATPAVPSTGTVRLFGHTSWTLAEYAAFNDLVAMKAGDEIVVTTKTGVFTYRAEAPQLVPYSQVAKSQLIWGDGDDRLVLVTCNAAESSGTIVEAWLVSAVSR